MNRELIGICLGLMIGPSNPTTYENASPKEKVEAYTNESKTCGYVPVRRLASLPSPWELYEKVMDVTVTTDFIKTTGFTGFLFGHYSQGNENQVLKQLQRQLAVELTSQKDLDINLIQLLPLTIEDAKITTIDSIEEARTGLFGAGRTDKFERYKVTYEIRVNLLSPRQIFVGSYESKGEVIPTVRVEYQKGHQWIPLGQIQSLDPNFLSLSAIDLEEPAEKVAKLRVSDLHVKYRYELGSYIAESLPHAKKVLLSQDTNIRIILDFMNSSGEEVSSSQILESTDRFIAKNETVKSLGLKGIGRYFDRFYYLHHLKRLKSRVFGGSPACQMSFFE